MGGDSDAEPQYPIGAVARRTGLTTHVLRAWERRYGVVDPDRSGGGMRLYSDADVVRLRLLRNLTELGYPIGQVARLDTAALLKMVQEDERAGPREREPDAAGAEQFVTACLAAIEAMDSQRIHSILMRAVVALSPMAFVEGVVGPLLRRVGRLWSQGDICPAHEHVLSVCIQRVLHWLLDTLPTEADAPVLVCTTLPGERHELGAMLAAVAAADAGWRVRYFGPELPVVDVARAVEVVRARAVALSQVFETEPAVLRSELASLRALLPGKVVVLMGGHGVERHRDMLTEIGITWYADRAALRTALAAANRR